MIYTSGENFIDNTKDSISINTVDSDRRDSRFSKYRNTLDNLINYSNKLEVYLAKNISTSQQECK